VNVALREPHLLSREPELIKQEILIRPSCKERRAVLHQHLVAELHTLIADEHSRASDDLLNITTALATETAMRFAD
jgi:hypothetical protein